MQNIYKALLKLSLLSYSHLKLNSTNFFDFFLISGKSNTS